MTEPKQWTIEDLDRVHPLPAGWRWAKDSEGDWCAWLGARWVSAPGGALFWDDPSLPPDNEVMCIPSDVALAVILAGKGLDSMEAMAREMDDRADEMAKRSQVGGGFSDSIHAATASGRAVQAAEAAAMLRRGTVKP
jgi:hypothetical protein